MTKPKPNKPGRGRKSSWGETKLTYLESLEALYRQGTQLFLDEAESYITKTWGFRLLPYSEPVKGVDYTPPDINSFPEEEREDESKHRSDFKTDLRKVVGSADDSKDGFLREMNTFTRNHMSKETPEFLKGLQQQNEDIYNAEMKEYEAEVEWTGTPEGYASAMKNGIGTLAPLSDAVAMVYGGIVTIAVTVPNPKNGKMQTRR
ncbi:hypothetical protein MPER_02098 [Moniliophthora perniciosa FA553]|nr:hypothetical protein MPER_02098 [Moniliophthora perniciosa FA553]